MSKTESLPQAKLVVGEAQCPECGKWVKLIAEADCWEQEDNGEWKITGYGPATAFCCDLLIAETDYDGRVQAFVLNKSLGGSGDNDK